MKPQVWRLILLIYVVGVGMAVVETDGAGSGANASLSALFGAADTGGGTLVAWNHSPSSDPFRAPGRRLKASAIPPGRPHLCGSAEPPADDSSQADDTQSGGDDAALASIEFSPRAAEWRLLQPDALGFDSHMNSKTRPPP
jgi:hypothetical protein